jgi:hypothetical protein
VLSRLKKLPLCNDNLAQASKQGCQMVYFETKNPNFGKFWRASKWKILVYVFYGHFKIHREFHIVSPRFGILYQEKYGNPGYHRHKMYHGKKKLVQNFPTSCSGFLGQDLRENAVSHVLHGLLLLLHLLLLLGTTHALEKNNENP